MQAYPFVFKKDDKLHMFYNGNGFGQSGLGYAIKTYNDGGPNKLMLILEI